MEVGVRVDARDVSGPLRHILTAFFTFVAKAANGVIPQVLHEDESSDRRYHDALGRRRLRDWNA